MTEGLLELLFATKNILELDLIFARLYHTIYWFSSSFEGHFSSENFFIIISLNYFMTAASVGVTDDERLVHTGGPK